MTGAVVEDPLLPLLSFDARTERRIDDEELSRDAARLGQECIPFIRRQVPVEVAGEDSIEGVIGHDKVQRIADNSQAFRQPGLGDRDHRGTLVDSDDKALQVPGQEAGATCRVERAARW